MEFSFESAGRRKSLLAVSLLIAAALSFQAARFWLATLRLDSGDLSLMERGAALMPGNGAAWDTIGQLKEWNLASPDPSAAVEDFQRAVGDDPRSAPFWMDLANAYEASGDLSRSADAFSHARSVYPASADVAFHYGNFLLRQQRTSEAYAEFQRAARADPALLPLVISRTWRSGGDIHALIDQAIPPTTDAYLQALDFFASIQQAQPAVEVWNRLVALKKPFFLPRTFDFFDNLIRQDRDEDARRAWPQAVAAAGVPNAAPGNSSAIWNGKFTSEFENGGLDWRWTPLLGVTTQFDSDSVPDGSRALEMDFNGASNIPLDEPRQFVPVEPNRAYHFHAYVRTQDITTESGTRISVTDPNHAGALNLLSDNFTGSHPWTPVDFNFTTGPDTHFLLVRVHRDSSRLFDSAIRGSAWIADFSLTPSPAQTEQPPR